MNGVARVGDSLIAKRMDGLTKFCDVDTEEALAEEELAWGVTHFLTLSNPESSIP